MRCGVDVCSVSASKTVKEIQDDKWLSLTKFFMTDIVQIVFVSFLYLDSNSLFIVGIDLTRTNAFVSLSLFVAIIVLQMIIIYYTALGRMGREDMIKLYPKFNKPKEWTCRHSQENLVKWTLEIAEKSGVTVNKIYLLRSPIPNAFTFSLPLVGSIVVVHSNLADLLNSEEVKAIISHEIAHIRNRDSIVQILARMPDFFVQIIYLYIYVRIGMGIVDALLVTFDIVAVIVRIIVLLAFFILANIMLYLGKRYIQRASRAAEHLADYHAAEILGPTNTINALLRLGQRVEAIVTLADELKWLAGLNATGIMPLTNEEINRAIGSMSSVEIDERVVRQNASRIFLENRLKLLRDTYGLALSDEQISTIVKPAVEKLIKTRGLTKKEVSTVDWRAADTDGDERLDSDELAKLVGILRKDPEKLMFDSEVGKNFLLMDHPDFRRRILFIADALGIQEIQD